MNFEFLMLCMLVGWAIGITHSIVILRVALKNLETLVKELGGNE